MAALPAWTSIDANCTHPPPTFHVTVSQITVPEPYIYVTNITGNRAILERCTGSTAVNYIDNTMPADAIGCYLVAHVEKGSANEAWQCFVDGRMEGQWGVMDKARSNGGERMEIGRRSWVFLGLVGMGVMFGML